MLQHLNAHVQLEKRKFGVKIPMPDELTKEAVQFLSFLLPGFLSAWIFYGLTSHPKPSQFERVVQALIFTFLIQALSPIIRWILELLGSIGALRPWDKAAENIVSAALAILLGGALAYCTNKDSIHKWLRDRGFTSRTSHPSEWFCVLSQTVTYVVLHLKDGRRLYGWPKEWPIECGKGQFYVMEPSWILENGNTIDLPSVEGILIEAQDIRWVEFIK